MPLGECRIKSWEEMKLKIKPIFVFCISLYISVAPSSSHSEIAFRSSTETGAQFAAVTAGGGVNAFVENGKIVFNTQRREAVIAYIHDASGAVVDQIIIPPRTQADFGSTQGAILGLLGPSHIRAIVDEGSYSSNMTSSISGIFNNTREATYESSYFAQTFPAGGSISYAIGTPETIFHTHLSVAAQVFVLKLKAALGNDSADDIFDKALKSVTEKLVTSDNISRFATTDSLGDKLMFVAGLMVEEMPKALKDFGIDTIVDMSGAGLLEQILEKPTKILTSTESVLNAAATGRNALLQQYFDPAIIKYDLSYDAQNEYLFREYRLNWNGTSLSDRAPRRYDAVASDNDQIKYFFGIPWNVKSVWEADRDRWSIDNNFYVAVPVIDLPDFNPPPPPQISRGAISGVASNLNSTFTLTSSASGNRSVDRVRLLSDDGNFDFTVAGPFSEMSHLSYSATRALGRQLLTLAPAKYILSSIAGG